MNPLVIDPAFAALIPPLTPDERTQLERNILAEGCRDPLVVWGEILLDGHNRYEICTRQNIPFKTVQKHFASRHEAETWMIHNQLGRRNLNNYQRSLLALKLKEVVAAEARERMTSGTKPDPTQNFVQGESNAVLGAMADVSRETIRKVAFIEQNGSSDVRSQALMGDISIHQAFQAARAAHAQQILHRSESLEWYTPARYVAAVHRLLGTIDVDPASSAVANEVVQAAHFYTTESDGLKQAWSGQVFLNPPYGFDGQDSNQAVWSQRLIEQYESGITSEAVLLVNATPERKWFQPLWDYVLCFTDHRIQFYRPGAEAHQPTHGNAFVYFGSREKAFAEIFCEFGTIVKRLTA